MTDYFSDRYGTARRRLLDLVQQRPAWTHEANEHPLAAPDGDAIYTDIFWRGPRDAAKVLVLCSGTHGVEGFTGSAIQSAVVDENSDLPDGAAMMLVHAVNPFGFAHLRRVNEDNIDLNRNFIDFDQPLPVNDGYRALDSIVNPAQWTDETGPAIAQHFQSMQSSMPYLEFLKTISGGQYRYPRGIQYGGAQPAWSRETMERVWQDYLARAKLVVQLDIHTGLGPKGHGVLMMAADDAEPHKAISADWFGPMMVTPRPKNREETVLGGYMNAALEEAIDAYVMPMTLEFGTEPPEAVLMTLIKDNWLAHHGDPSSAQGQEVREQVLRAFYPDDAAWRSAVMERAHALIASALDGMANLDPSLEILR